MRNSLTILAAAGIIALGLFFGLRERSAEPGLAVALDSAGYRDCADCPEMRFIRGATFSMGSPEGDTLAFSREHPQHNVTVPDFWIGVHEVTVGQWAEFRAASPDEAPGCGSTDEHPVACVNWYEAKAYAAWLAQTTGRRYRLPTEAEWEYAARGGTTTPWFWGTDPDDVCRYANSGGTCGEDTFDGITSPVGGFQANAFGLHDTAGNVYEWVEDCRHDDYIGAPRNGSEWTNDCSFDGYVFRGGSFYRDPRNLRAAYRYFSHPGSRSADLGFRVVWRVAGGQES